MVIRFWQFYRSGRNPALECGMATARAVVPHGHYVALSTNCDRSMLYITIRALVGSTQLMILGFQHHSFNSGGQHENVHILGSITSDTPIVPDHVGCILQAIARL